MFVQRQPAPVPTANTVESDDKNVCSVDVDSRKEMRNKAKNPYHFYVRFLYFAVYEVVTFVVRSADQFDRIRKKENTPEFRCTKGAFNGWENCIPQIYCQIEFFPFSFLFAPFLWWC